MSVDVRLVRWPDQDRAEFERLAAALARVKAAARASAAGFARQDVPTGPEEPSDRERAKALIAQRRARDTAAGANGDLFSEPSWDIILLLFVAHEDDFQLDLAGICHQVGCSAQSGARWIRALLQRGLVSVGDGTGVGDGVVGHVGGGEPVSITAAGAAFVRRCLQAI